MQALDHDMRVRTAAVMALMFFLAVGMPMLFLASPPGSDPPYVPGFSVLYEDLKTIAGEPVARVAWAVMCFAFAVFWLSPARRPGPGEERTEHEAIEEYLGELPPHEITVEQQPSRKD